MRLPLIILVLAACDDLPPTTLTVTPSTQVAEIGVPFQWKVETDNWRARQRDTTITVGERGLIEITGVEGDDVSGFEWNGMKATYRYDGIVESHTQTVTAVCLAAEPAVSVDVDIPSVLVKPTTVSVSCVPPESSAPVGQDEFLLGNLIVAEIVKEVWTISPDRGAAANFYLFTEPVQSDLRGNCAITRRETYESRPIPDVSVVTPDQSFDFVQTDGVVGAAGLVAGPMFSAAGDAEVTVGDEEPQTVPYDDTDYLPPTSAEVDRSGAAPVLEVHADGVPDDTTVRLTMSATGSDGLTTLVDCTVPSSDFVQEGDDLVLRQSLGSMPGFLEGTSDFAPISVLVGVYHDGTLMLPDADEPVTTYTGDIVRFDKPSGFLIWEDDSEVPGDDVLDVPATASLTSAGQVQVAVCESNMGSFVFASSPAGLCPFAPPGTVYTPYLLFRGSPELTVEAMQDSDGDSTSDLELLSTTVGMLVDGMPDRVTGIPVDTPTTIVTSDLTVTFDHDGAEVTITALRP